jgi:hypothetical protein
MKRSWSASMIGSLCDSSKEALAALYGALVSESSRQNRLAHGPPRGDSNHKDNDRRILILLNTQQVQNSIWILMVL